MHHLNAILELKSFAKLFMLIGNISPLWGGKKGLTHLPVILRCGAGLYQLVAAVLSAF